MNGDERATTHADTQRHLDGKLARRIRYDAVAVAVVVNSTATNDERRRATDVAHQTRIADVMCQSQRALGVMLRELTS